MALKTYRYKQITPQGKIIRGLIFATGEQLGASLLDQQQNHTLKLRELCWIESLLFRPRISEESLLNLTIQWYQLLKAGVVIQKVIRILANLYFSNFIQSSLTQIRTQLLSGEKLSQALQTQPFLFNVLYCHTIQVGEEQGGLIQAFEKLVAHIHKRVEIKRKLKKAIFYPTILASMMVLLLISLSIFLLPQLQEFIMSFGLPLSRSTWLLLWLGENIRQFGGLLCIGVVLLTSSLGALYVLSERFAYRVDRALLKTPFLGSALILYNLARYLIDFRIFCNDGRSALKALQEAPSAVTNLYLKMQFLDLSEQIHEGNSLTSLFSSLPWFPEAIAQMIKVGESSGQLTQALIFCEEFVQRDLWSNIEKYLRLLEPLLLLMIGGFLLWIVIAIFLPLYDHLGVL